MLVTCVAAAAAGTRVPSAGDRRGRTVLSADLKRKETVGCRAVLETG